MANPVTRLGRQNIFDPENEGRRQDRERREREDEEFYRRTGIRRPPIAEYSPLVDNNPNPDIANDGDSYVEENPSEIIDTVASPLEGLFSDHISSIDHVVNAQGDIISTITERRIINSTRNNAASRINETNKELQKQKQKEEEEFQKLVEESRKEIGNAIEGLDI